jgi:hypothetical protein
MAEAGLSLYRSMDASSTLTSTLRFSLTATTTGPAHDVPGVRGACVGSMLRSADHARAYERLRVAVRAVFRPETTGNFYAYFESFLGTTQGGNL